MQVTTTFRHMDSSQALRQYATERMTKLRKYFRREPIAAHAVFSVENDHQHAVELALTLPNGLVVQAHETTEDMYSSIDLASARIERQIRRWKDKIRDHKPHGGPSFPTVDRVLHASILEPVRPGSKASGKGRRKARQVEQAPGRGSAAGKAATRLGERKSVRPTAPAAPLVDVVREQPFTVRTMRVDEAVMQLNLVDSSFLVFNDADTGSIHVVYRRKDGHYGLIDTGAKVSPGSADAGQKGVPASGER